jgi:hypothetical protein
MASDIGESVDNTKHALDHLLEDGILPGIFVTLISGTHPRRVDIADAANIRIEDLSAKSGVETIEIPAGIPVAQTLDKRTIDKESRDRVILKKRTPGLQQEPAIAPRGDPYYRYSPFTEDFTRISNMVYYVPPVPLRPSDLAPKPISKSIDISPSGMKTNYTSL